MFTKGLRTHNFDVNSKVRLGMIDNARTTFWTRVCKNFDSPYQIKPVRDRSRCLHTSMKQFELKVLGTLTRRTRR